MSQIGLTATLPLSAIERRVGSALMRNDVLPAGKKTVTTRFGRLGAVVTEVWYRPEAAGLRLYPHPRHNALTVRLPISIVVRNTIAGAVRTALLSRGCGPGRLYLDLGITFRKGVDGVDWHETVSAHSHGYRCTVGLRGPASVAADGVNVLRRGRDKVLGALTGRRPSPRRIEKQVEIGGRLREAVQAAAAAGVKDVRPILRSLVGGRVSLSSVNPGPLVFGGAMALGLDAAGFQADGVTVTDRALRLTGHVHGRPRVEFGGGWPDRQTPDTGVESAPGFQLPLRVLFSRDAAWLQAVMKDAAGRGGFRISPVPDRPDRLVVQYVQDDTARDLVWLTGSQLEPGGQPVEFNEPLNNVLDELLCWLDEPARWQGIASIEALRAEVAGFRSLLARFEGDTELALGGADRLIVHDLRVDLLRAWVTPEAIWADIVLRGDADLEILPEI